MVWKHHLVDLPWFYLELQSMLAFCSWAVPFSLGNKSIMLLESSHQSTSAWVNRQKLIFYQPCWLKCRSRYCQIFSSGFSLIGFQVAPPCCLFTHLCVCFCVLISSCKVISQNGWGHSPVAMFVFSFKTHSIFFLLFENSIRALNVFWSNPFHFLSPALLPFPSPMTFSFQVHVLIFVV